MKISHELTKRYNVVAKKAYLGIDAEDLKLEWSELVVDQLKDWGFNDESAKVMIEWGRGGHNWTQLHFDRTKTRKESLEKFAFELDYVVGRINSLDILLRCAWLFNAALYTPREDLR